MFLRTSMERIGKRKEEVVRRGDMYRQTMLLQMAGMRVGIDRIKRGAAVAAALLPLWELIRPNRKEP
jgi:hypothetical protein